MGDFVDPGGQFRFEKFGSIGHNSRFGISFEFAAMSIVTPLPQYAYMPVAQAQPYFANVIAAQSVMNVPPDVVAIISAAQSFSVRQHAKVLPKNCCSCPPCVKQENTYSIYAGMDRNSEAEFLRIDEVSDDWNRACCAPYHPVKLEARAVIPTPGANSDWDNMMGDGMRDFNNFSKQMKWQKQREQYNKFPVLFTMVRDDGMRCCYKCPCKWLNTFVCFGCCQDGMKVYAGATPEPTDGSERGRPVDIGLDRLLGSVEQPNFAGCCTPTLNLRGEREDMTATPYAKLEGPCFFGGMSEFCCDFRFFLSKFDSPSKTGDIGAVVKQKPQSMAAALVEMMTEADNYTIQFEPSAQMTFSQKVTVMSAQILADYMYFDGATEKMTTDAEGNTTINCFYCSIIGLLVPCQCTLGGGNSGN